ncbi:MAG: GNAT family N-acetyltransferase [Acidimicrobiales bacterium]
MTAPTVVQWGGERARVGSWRGDAAIGQLSPVPGSPPPSAAFVHRCVATLRQQGFTRVVTGALTTTEQAGFLKAGFAVSEHLHLLARDLRTLPPSPTALLRKAAQQDHPEVLEIDTLAFSPFWRLDPASLIEAVRATPHTRFRVACDADADGSPAPGGRLIGYAIVGRSGRRGYLQRLAVRPGDESRGVGRALILDGLRWLRRWRADEVLVNTQHENARALALYEQLGFARQPSGLTVLGIDL